ncbi:MAG: BolA family protein [Pseudomonadota bacterium]
MTARIRTLLEAAFAPTEITVVDESEQHRGHAGYQEGGESHFAVRLRSSAFEGRSRIARHRAVHSALGPEVMTAIHALALDLDTPARRD